MVSTSAHKGRAKESMKELARKGAGAPEQLCAGRTDTPPEAGQPGGCGRRDLRREAVCLGPEWGGSGWPPSVRPQVPAERKTRLQAAGLRKSRPNDSMQHTRCRWASMARPRHRMERLHLRRRGDASSPNGPFHRREERDALPRHHARDLPRAKNGHARRPRTTQRFREKPDLPRRTASSSPRTPAREARTSAGMPARNANGP